MMGLSKLLKRTLTSTFLLVVVYLSLLPFVFAYVRPLQHLDLAQAIPINRRTLVGKISNYLTSGKKPEVVFVGSSLLLVPAVRSDDEMLQRPTRYDQPYSWYIQDYSKAKYFAAQLQKQAGRMLQVDNLGVTGAMVSDVSLIVNKAISVGRKPQLIIYGIAPRDFMNTEISFITRTSTYQLLGDLSCLPDLLKHQTSFSEMAEFALGNIWHFYSERGDYRALMTNWICQLTGHPATLAEATDGPKVDKHESQPAKLSQAEKVSMSDLATGRVNTLNDLRLYKYRYNPPNLPLLTLQTRYFEELLQACNEAGVPLMVVNMPLTKQNKDLIPAGILDRYRHAINRLTTKHGVKFIDIDLGGGYELTDFEDSCHLNASGGRKLYQQLIAALKDSSLLTH